VGDGNLRAISLLDEIETIRELTRSQGKGSQLPLEDLICLLTDSNKRTLYQGELLEYRKDLQMPDLSQEVFIFEFNGSKFILSGDGSTSIAKK
jgi:hypothetical protein